MFLYELKNHVIEVQSYKFVINIRILHDLNQGPLLLDGLLGSKMTSLLKSKNFEKSSFGVDVIKIIIIIKKIIK